VKTFKLFNFRQRKRVGEIACFQSENIFVESNPHRVLEMAVVARRLLVDHLNVEPPWHVQCSNARMTSVQRHAASQPFDDSHFFQRLTLIDICCGPPCGN
jgi:hypothetical protein